MALLLHAHLASPHQRCCIAQVQKQTLGCLQLHQEMQSAKRSGTKSTSCRLECEERKQSSRAWQSSCGADRDRARDIDGALETRCKSLLHLAQRAPLSLALLRLSLRARLRLGLRARPLSLQAGARFCSLPAGTWEGSPRGAHGLLHPLFGHAGRLNICKVFVK